MAGLHIDYRPQDFDEFYGNDATVKKLIKVLEKDEDTIPRTWLFQGPSGCGKTTLARIIASKLGCQPEDSNPDYVEINMANNRGIETGRQIISNLNYKPTTSKCRIWLLDEVHQGTRDFANSLLKALEDTPKHTHFILCTTDPQKLLPTIKTRCSIFEVGKLGYNEIADLANWVLDCENLESLAAKTEELFVKASEGCPRQALILLDQIIGLEEQTQIEALKNFRSDEAQVIDLCRALIKHDSLDKLTKILKGLEQNNADPENIRRAVLGYIKSVALNGNAGDPLLIFEAFKEPVFYTGFPGIVFASINAFVSITDFHGD